ncbi:hypothetical protein GGI35DRAFT_441294 [Trichoderma velutinum]
MRFVASVLLNLVLVVSVIASPLIDSRDNNDEKNPNVNIFPAFKNYEDWAICKGKITKHQFPNLQAPENAGGCVRYYRGIDMTGVVTELHFYFKDNVRSACDCAIKCLERPAICTNWVWKHTFMKKLDSGKRSCTLYSSPNLPTGVTLDYNLGKSKGFQPLQAANNPQVGALAPLTFLDAANTKPDKFGVSGFITEDQNKKLYC